ncbi:unnamed protein product [Calypogeia fissa]
MQAMKSLGVLAPSQRFPAACHCPSARLSSSSSASSTQHPQKVGFLGSRNEGVTRLRAGKSDGGAATSDSVAVSVRASSSKGSSSSNDAVGEREGWSFRSVANSVQKCMLCAALAAAVALPVVTPAADVFAAAPGPVVSELAGLIAGPPVKDPEALLRYALPIANKPIKEVQKTLEEITDILKLPGAKAIDPVERVVRQTSRLVNQNKEGILADVSAARKEEAQKLLSKLGDGLVDFQRILEVKDRNAIAPKQRDLLDIVGDVEEAMVDKFPYDLPAEYASKPWLKGRASVEMKVKVKGNPNLKDAVFEITVDGYNAPVTSGNFIDLVVRRFYDGMEIQRADGFVVQTGDPNGPADGFVDPSTGKLRTIPLEIMVDGDKEPIYGATLEELGRYREQTRLPFNAFGTMAMAREEFSPDSASSQIFWLLKESELTPSNANILDGTYAVFGYVTKNEDLFADLKVGDVIESIKVTNGLDNLVNPSYAIGGA